LTPHPEKRTRALVQLMVMAALIVFGTGSTVSGKCGPRGAGAPEAR
jgi:hypothetical protein